MITVRRLASVLAALTIAAGSQLVLNPTATAHAPAAAAAATPVKTPFVLEAFAYATRVVGGQVSPGSDRTAFALIACTNLAGLTRTNTQVGVIPPQLAAIHGVASKVWTVKGPAGVHSYGENTIAKVTLTDDELGSLAINGVTARSHTWHNQNGFFANNVTTIGSLVLTPTAGEPQVLPLPTPGNPVDTPLGTLTIGHQTKAVSSTGAIAQASTVDITLPTGGSVIIGNSRTTINNGSVQGIFRGASSGLKATAVQGVLGIGATPNLVHPCQGTYGKVRAGSIASLTPPSGFTVEGLKAAQWSRAGALQANGWQSGSVAEFVLGDNQIRIVGATGVARATRTAKGLTRSTVGTTPGVLYVNGEAHDWPAMNPVEIPGVAKLEPRVVTRTPYGVSVTAVRITLPAGSVILLGNATFGISPS